MPWCWSPIDLRRFPRASTTSPSWDASRSPPRTATNDGIDAMGNPSAGTIVYTGPLEAGLTDERLSELFGMPIEVQHTHGRWSAFAV